MFSSETRMLFSNTASLLLVYHFYNYTSKLQSVEPCHIEQQNKHEISENVFIKQQQ